MNGLDDISFQVDALDFWDWLHRSSLQVYNPILTFTHQSERWLLKQDHTPTLSENSY